MRHAWAHLARCAGHRAHAVTTSPGRSALGGRARRSAARRPPVDSPPRETRRRALPGRLRRPADRPPADGHPADHGQDRRLGAGALRRRLLQAAELDVAAVQGRARASARTASPEWLVTGKDDDTLRILLEEVLHDTAHDLGIDPGLQKDGVEKHLQELLADHPATLADGLTLVRREFPTAIGPVDLMCRDADGPVGRGRDQAARRDRRRRAADPLPRAAQPRPAAAPGARHLRRPGDQAAGPGAGHRPRHRLRGRRLRRPARHGRPDRAAVLMRIFHLTTPEVWAAAQQAGAYTTSTRGRSLEQEGFIHCSEAHQVEGVRAPVLRRRRRTWCCSRSTPTCSPRRGAASSSPGADQPFPHVYGPLDLDAVGPAADAAAATRA